MRTTLNDLLDGFAVIAMRSSRCVQPTLHAVGDAVVGMVKTASVRHARMSKRSDSALDRERRSVRAAWTDKQAEIALCISFERLTEMHALEAFINAEIMPMIDRDRIALIDMTARRVVIAALERARIDKGGARGAESTVCILRQRSVLPAGEVRFEDLPSADPDQKAAIDYDAPDDMVVLPSRSGTVAIAITGATALIKTADGDARMIDVARVAPQATTLDVSAVIWRNVHRLRDRLTCLDDQAQRRSRSR